MSKMPARYMAILDVGHGSCCVIHDAKCVSVVDTGLGTVLMEFLEQNGVDEVDVVILSHADKDHVSGLIQLLAAEEFSIGEVFLNPDATKGPLWDDLIEELDQQAQKHKLRWNVTLTSDDNRTVKLDTVSMDVLAPSQALIARGAGTKKPKKIESNTVSCVLRVTDSGRGVAVLPGDVDSTGLDDLLSRLKGNPRQTDAPVLVFPHHGGMMGGDTQDFVEKLIALVNPDTVVFSIGRDRHGTPRPETVAVIRSKVKDVRIACTQSSRHCFPDDAARSDTHLLPLIADGRDGGNCCAGTMLIDLDSGSADILPNRLEHDAFVTRHAGVALCRK